MSIIHDLKTEQMTLEERNQLAIDWIQENAPDYVLQYLDQDANASHLYTVSLEMGIESLEKQTAALEQAYAVAAAIMRARPVWIAPRLVSEWRAAAPLGKR